MSMFAKTNISGQFQAVSGQNRPGSGRNSKITPEMVFPHLNTYVLIPICLMFDEKMIFRQFQAVGQNRPEIGRKFIWTIVVHLVLSTTDHLRKK